MDDFPGKYYYNYTKRFSEDIIKQQFCQKIEGDKNRSGNRIIGSNVHMFRPSTCGLKI